MAGNKFCSMSSILVSLLIICCASILSPTSSARTLILPDPACPQCVCCGPAIIPLEAARPVDPDVITVDPDVSRPIDPDVDIPIIRTPAIRAPIIRTPIWPPIRTPPPPPPRVIWPPRYCCRCCRWIEPVDPVLQAPQIDQIAASASASP